MIRLNDSLIDSWRKEFQESTGFELGDWGEEGISSPRFLFDYSFEGESRFPRLPDSIVGELTLHFFIKNDPSLYRTDRSPKPFDLFLTVVLPFFAGRYGIHSKSLRMKTGRKSARDKREEMAGHFEFTLFRLFYVELSCTSLDNAP